MDVVGLGISIGACWFTFRSYNRLHSLVCYKRLECRKGMVGLKYFKIHAWSFVVEVGTMKHV